MTHLAIALTNRDEQRLLFGPRDKHLRTIRDTFSVRLYSRGGELHIEGDEPAVSEAHDTLSRMLTHVRRTDSLDTPDVDRILRGRKMETRGGDAAAPPRSAPATETARASGPGQRHHRPIHTDGAEQGGGWQRASRSRSMAARAGEDPDRETSRGDADRTPEHLIDDSARTSWSSEGGVGGQLFKADAKPLTEGQSAYMKAVLEHDLVFCTGPAGTGKTFLATAMAVDALNRGLVRKLVLVRPAVEAGEKLGFLPGGFQEKINPYLRPIFDALGSLLDFAAVKRYVERDVIEVAPLAYMRGRTLENAFIILDEAQNTTPSQMLMFLTRIGRKSKAVVTGDDTQVDLPMNQQSGLLDALRILRNTTGIAFVGLRDKDIVRHNLVQRIVDAYSSAEEQANYPLFRDTQPIRRPTRFDEPAERTNAGSRADARSDAPWDPNKADVRSNPDPTGSESPATTPPPDIDGRYD